MTDGIVEIDSEFGKTIGFTSDKFSGDSYLWREGTRIMMSLIFSKNEGQGNLSALFEGIEAQGLIVAVPTPLGRMGAILKKKGFVMHLEENEMGAYEVWQKPEKELL